MYCQVCGDMISSIVCFVYYTFHSHTCNSFMCDKFVELILLNHLCLWGINVHISWVTFTHVFTSPWTYSKLITYLTLQCIKTVNHEMMFQGTRKILIIHVHWTPTNVNDSTVLVTHEIFKHVHWTPTNINDSMVLVNHEIFKHFWFSSSHEQCWIASI